MTVEQYILHEIELWGEDEVTRLLDDGFYPVLTDRGYKWLMAGRVLNSESLKRVIESAPPE